MGNTRFLAGLAGNVLRQANNITASSENANFLVGNIGDGLPADPYVGGTPAANDHVTVDACQISDPSFDSDVVGDVPPSPWVAIGSVVVSSDQSNSSPNSARINDGGQSFYQQREVVPNADYDVSVALFGNGTDLVQAKLLNVNTGRYLSSGGSWGDTEVAFATRSAASWATSTVSGFTVENSGHGVVELRLIIDTDASGSVSAMYADDLLLLPEISFGSLHGHNLVSKQAIQIRRSTDNFSGSNIAVATMTHEVVRVFDIFTAPAITRYWRFLFPEDNVTEIAIHQAVLGSVKTMTRSADIGRGEPVVMPQAEAVTRSRVRYRTNLSEHELKDYILRFSARTAGLAEMVDEIFKACRSGKDPIVLIPDDARTNVTHGRMSPGVDVTRQFLDRWEFGLTFEEDAFSIDIP